MRSAVLPSVLSLVITCGLVGCAHDAPPRPPAEDTIPTDALPPPDVLPLEARAVPEAGRFVLTGIRRPIVASITDAGIQGPDVNLGRYKKQDAIEWRGTAFNQMANLTVSGSGAEGIVGGNPLKLQVTPAPASPPRSPSARPASTADSAAAVTTSSSRGRRTLARGRAARGRSRWG